MENTTRGNWQVWVTPGDTLYIATEQNVHIAALLHYGKKQVEVARNATLLAASKDLLRTAQMFKSACEVRISILAEERHEVIGYGIEPNDIDDQLGHWQALLRDCKMAIAKAEGKSPAT